MKVLLVEDNPEITRGITLTFQLRWPDAAVVSAPNGTKGIQAVEKEIPDIIILDINLPDISGFDVLEKIRKFSNVPVIIVTVRNDEVDQLRGLEMGADDYIVKPFSPTTLLARVKAVLRRSGSTLEEELPPFSIGNLSIDFSTRVFCVDGEQVHLTPTESRVLYCLAREPGRLIATEVLMEQVWGRDAKYVDNSSLKTHIYQLRTKLGDSGQNPRLIINEHGLGYKLVKPPELPK